MGMGFCERGFAADSRFLTRPVGVFGMTGFVAGKEQRCFRTAGQPGAVAAYFQELIFGSGYS
jgi:hypothetical protein